MTRPRNVERTVVAMDSSLDQAFNEEVSTTVSKTNLRDRLVQTCSNFERAYNLARMAKESNTVPKIIHKIWWQSIEKLPEKYIEPLISWQHNNPDWHLVVWDADHVRSLFANRFKQYEHILYEHPLMIQKIDVAKYFILAEYGGCYSDMDQTCLKPLNTIINTETESSSIMAAALTEKLSLIMLASSFKFYAPPYLNNAFIIAKADINVWGIVFYQLERQLRLGNDGVLGRIQQVKVLRTTGPVCFTKAIRKIVKSREGAVRLLSSILVEPFSLYFKTGNNHMQKEIVERIHEHKASLAISDMPSSWAGPWKGPVHHVIKRYVQYAYKNDIKRLMSGRRLKGP